MDGIEAIGSRSEFHALVERHARPLYRLAYRMTGNETDAEDLVQETFMKAWKQRARFDGRASLGTWLHRICANCSLDLLRARKRRQEANGDDADDPMGRAATEAPSPERLTLSDEVSGILSSALAELTSLERTAFVMRHYDGVGIEEIATTLGVQSGAAKHSVFRAVQKLRRALEPVAGFNKSTRVKV
ncbi:MAG: polymerase, sigma-24 subunit, subfamily [Bryobacterales bacterium]|nr:polymerase, sigma-24 subunit, subfamily [Bryobacterales bacterium]